jgi:sugar transferase (PEP-CTERM/EpsH1 system associated)
MNRKPLIAHVLYRFDTGGMERIIVSLINGTRARYRHAVICLAGVGAMRAEINDPDVACLSLEKKPGKDFACYGRLWRALRRLKPDLVTTYNIGALDAAPIIKLAGAGPIVHAEHGRDAADPHGRNRRYRWLRRRLQPFIARFVTVSRDLDRWLREEVGIAPAKIVCIPNGIDTARYRAAPYQVEKRPLLGSFAPPGTPLVMTVGRLDPVKDHAGLIEAVHELCTSEAEHAKNVRLAIVGDGAERGRLQQLIARRNLDAHVKLLGNREDVAALLAEADVFALSSVAEGIPLTVLEAMAAGLPVVATNVGGVGEVLVDGVTGTLVAPSDPAALARALHAYLADASLRQRHGAAGRERAESRFGLRPMIAAYGALYDQLLARKSTSHAASGSAGVTKSEEH